MLIYNLRRIMALRGIDKPHTFLVQNGFAASTASNMLAYYPVVFKVKSLEKLCVALKCTPNDLFEWQETEKSTVAANHPLQALVREKPQAIAELVKDLPIEKLEELGEIISKMKRAD